MDVAQRPLSEILVELGEVQDRLLEADSEDFATRADLSNRQDELRQEAKDARDGLPLDDLGVEQLEREIAHLEDELERYLGTRPSASAASGGGGPGGGGIDPGFLHAMHRQMDSSFGYAAKDERLQALRVRLARLLAAVDEQSPRPLDGSPKPSKRSRFLLGLAVGASLVGALVIGFTLRDGNADSQSVTTAAFDVLVPGEASVLVTYGDKVAMFDAQGGIVTVVRGVAGDGALDRSPARVAYRDLAAGLVYLEDSGWQIRHWPDPESAAGNVIGVGERGVELFDVALIEGRPTVVAGLHLNDGDDDWTQLALVDIETFESTAVAAFGRVPDQRDPPRVIRAASYAEERILVSVWQEDSWWFELYDLDGARLGGPLPHDQDDPGSLVGHGVLSPDGATMAYASGGNLIVADSATGNEIGRWPTGSPFYRIERLDYNGTLAVISFDDQPRPILINIDTDTATTLPAAGIATLIDR